MKSKLLQFVVDYEEQKQNYTARNLITNLFNTMADKEKEREKKSKWRNLLQYQRSLLLTITITR